MGDISYRLHRGLEIPRKAPILRNLQSMNREVLMDGSLIHLIRLTMKMDVIHDQPFLQIDESKMESQTALMLFEGER